MTSPQRRGVSRAIPVFTVVSTMVATVSGLLWAWAATYPTGNFLLAWVSLMVAAVAGLAWLVLVILTIVGRRFHWGTLVAPALIAGAVGAVATGLPEKAGFMLARPTLERAANDGSCPTWAGVVPIESCFTLGDNGSGFLAKDAGLLNTAGWARLAPEDAAQVAGNQDERAVTLVALGDGWYVVIFGW